MTKDPLPADQDVLARELRRHVETLAGLIGPRHLGRPSANDATLAYIERSLSEAGEHVTRETFRTHAAEATNLVLERPGTKKPAEIVLLGAHHDTVPQTPGADDNASAVAVLIEVARLLRGQAAKRTIRFVAFANEEPPFFMTQTMGSHIHAKGCHDRGERIVGMLCLEMVGFYADAPGSQRWPAQLPKLVRWALPTRGDFLAAVGNLKSKALGWRFRRGFKRHVRFKLLSVCLPERLFEIRMSDQSSFWDYGYPALMLTDTSFFRNPNYHTSRDLPDTLDYARMARVVRGVAGGVMRCAT